LSNRDGGFQREQWPDRNGLLHQECPPMTAPSVREALETKIALAINEGLCRQIDAKESTDTLNVTSKIVALPCIQSLIDGAATPPAPTPSAARERIARIIDPEAFTQAEAARNDRRWHIVEVCERAIHEALIKADAILAILPDAAATGAVRSLSIDYTNYRGETAARNIIPRSVRFGSTEWHPEEQWLLLAWDNDKQADREFALKDFGPSAAAIRAVAFEEAAKIADALGDKIMKKAEKAHRREDYDTYEQLECAATEYSRAASAIRAAGENAK
jgi:hypothetical protein